jgi:hypothetical protein
MIVADCVVLGGTALAVAFDRPPPPVRGLQVAVLISLCAKAGWGVALILLALAVQPEPTTEETAL